jgi:predicted nucleic acid-binding protein
LIGRSTTFEINLSVPLVLEYEEVLKRQARSLGLTHSDIDDILDYFCLVGNRREIFFLWRPFLIDPRDDLVLEVAVASSSGYIVTFNTRDFRGTEKFGVMVVSPREFLRAIGEAG